jgi:atypical dual specificity phosphatase
MPVPGRDRSLDQDATFLEQEGIRVLVSLTEKPPDADTLAAHAIEQEHLPIQDYAPPTLEQMTAFVSLVEEEVTTGRPVGVHCTAGLGRSGTMAAAYLVSTGASADDAISFIRDLRPGSIETPEQEQAVRLFETTQSDHQ